MLPSILRVLLLCALCSGAVAAPVAAIPVEVDAALARAKIPRDAVALLVVDADGSNAVPRLSHRAQAPMNPASVMKLVTTYAALDLLGPAYAWNTPVYVDGAVRDGTLTGNVYIKGQGDPKLVLERLWLLLRRLQGLGIRQIAGDIVLDRSALDVPDTDPASFDGEPLRPYNASPDALLINYKSVVMTFTPDRGSNAAQVQFDPPLYGVLTQNTVPLSNAECGDYRAALKADFSDASRIRFAGSYAADCGEKVWPVAYAEPRSYALRAVQGLWLDMGGKLTGNVRYGTVPAPLAAGKPTLESTSAPLAEIIRDINKFSNNVMAQQVFLTLGRVLAPPADASAPATDAASGMSGGSFIASRAVIQRWWKDRISTEDVPVLDNGSGLSRNERISAQGLALLLQKAYRSPTMPELMSSLPLTGVDGTLKRFKSKAMASAHLKTGSLSNVIARAGYVDGASGKRYILVALINHANASTDAARTVMETLVDWVAKDN
ncbi:D-alanyl-D-alanine carboxypeptidase/D-alanyl-D-alanine-endopeptidase [Rhodoferax sp. GW822-FHT02A01]|uniref:D-alanyl-D-alanine carboxypeptidase/D-alanyl-D-alanine endopeptidase n=1 Tax=Rhodoferax sp. GW822-FHT02A01 TaxID=3141537 RepID=UPI00315CCF5F